MTKKSKRDGSGVLIRNFVFGVEDSLVSTVGLLSGVAAAGVGKQTVFLTGAILIFVEALSMAVGSFLSEESTEEHDRLRLPKLVSIGGSLIMFFSYYITGFIPLLPYLLFEKEQAFSISILLSLVSLGALGLFSAYFGRKRYAKRVAEMVFLGGITIVAGIFVGNLVQNF